MATQDEKPLLSYLVKQGGVYTPSLRDLLNAVMRPDTSADDD